MNKDLGIKIAFVIILIISLYLIISGFSSKEEVPVDNGNKDILEEDLQASPTSINLIVGEQQQITAIVLPENTTNKELTWTTANDKIATIDNGLVTAVGPGKTVVKVSTAKRQITKIINVTVSKKDVPVTEIKVLEQNIELEVGDSKKIEYEVLPKDATNKKVSFSTSNKSIIGFNQDGSIVAVNAGDATITLKSNNDVVTTINVKVKNKTINVSKVTLNKKSLSLEIGKSATLTAKVSPTNATNKNVTWETSNEKVATVSNGKITAKKKGTATITVKTADGGLTATCKVTVKEKAKDTLPAIVPSNYSDHYESATFKYYFVDAGRYYLTYFWMEDPYNQIKKLDANVAKYGKVLKDSELTGSYTPQRANVGDMMQGYINYGIIPVNKAAVGYNASGFYVKGAWDPPATYYNLHANSWFDMMDGVILRNYQDDGMTDSGMIGISSSGDLKIYPWVSKQSERVTVYNNIMNDKVKNTWSFYPPLVQNGKAADPEITNFALRQGICQVNSNNYIMLTTKYGHSYAEMTNIFLSLGCQTAHNLDGGGSTSMFIKKAGASSPTQIKCSDGSSHSSCRSIIEGIYFTEK